MTMQAPAAVPFQLGSRRIIERIFSGTFTPGGAQIAADLSRVGYLAGLLIRISGTYTVATATPGPRAGFPYDYVQRFQLDLPGLNDPIALSGAQLKAQNLLANDLTMFGRGGGIGAMFDTDQMSGVWMKNADYLVMGADVYPVAVAANAWNLTWYLPVAHNARDFRGLIPLGNSQTATLRVTPGADADLVATTANHTASALILDVFQVFQTAPPAGVAAPDTNWAIVFDQYEQAATAVGDQVIDIPRDGIILNVLHQYRNVDTAYPVASTVAAQIDTVSFRVNRDKLWDSVPLFAKLIEQNAGRTIPIPAGFIAYDFDRDQGGIPFIDGNGERSAGWLYSEGLSEVKSTIHVPSGATQTNAKITTTVKRLMRL